MKKSLLSWLCLASVSAFCQPEITSWQLNNNGEKASYWLSGGNPQNPTFTYTPTNDSAKVLKVCYRTDSVWIYTHGMVFNMGKYLNPGACSSKTYIYRFPRVPSIPTNKTISPKVGAIGFLVNGIPMYGLSNASSWNGTTNANNGAGVWNVEVYLSEGFVLDTALGAHPQQQGAYHSHAKPRRLYQNTPTNQHSPIVGYAFDGHPVYGPYGYSTPTNSASAVARMKTGYSLRSITIRTALPYGVTASQTGPPVNSTYPIGTYCEDYEWLASNGGDLDKYNGRFCVTPEYPQGTYAYFTTIDASGTPEFPYYIGIEYYGAPDTKALLVNPGIKFPTTGTSCNLPTNLDETVRNFNIKVYPNPSGGTFTFYTEENLDLFSRIEIVSLMGKLVYSAKVESESTTIHLPSDIAKGVYFLRVTGKESQVYSSEKIIIH